MSNANERILTDKNYYLGLNKLINNNFDVWSIMTEENLLSVSGENPTPETYCHLCLLAQSKKPVIKDKKSKSELCVECGQDLKHPIGDPDLCRICTGKKMLRLTPLTKESFVYG